PPARRPHRRPCSRDQGPRTKSFDVYYLSRPAREIPLSPRHQDQTFVGPTVVIARFERLVPPCDYARPVGREAERARIAPRAIPRDELRFACEDGTPSTACPWDPPRSSAR